MSIISHASFCSTTHPLVPAKGNEGEEMFPCASQVISAGSAGHVAAWATIDDGRTVFEFDGAGIVTPESFEEFCRSGLELVAQLQQATVLPVPRSSDDQLCEGCIGRGTGSRCSMCGRMIPDHLRRTPDSPSEIDTGSDTGSAAPVTLLVAVAALTAVGGVLTVLAGNAALGFALMGSVPASVIGGVFVACWADRTPRSRPVRSVADETSATATVKAVA